MATFFGEVILPSSRVFFNDNEDSDTEESSEKKALEIKLYGNNCVEDQYELLIITEGLVARGVSDLYLLGNKCVQLAEIYMNKSKRNDDDENIQQKEQNTVLFRLNSETLLLQVSSTVDLTLANQLMLKIIPWIEKCKKVMTLCSKALWKYRCESADSLPSSFVRSLATTSAFSENPSTLNFLEQPNFITGFSASVMAWCECKKKSCILHINYNDKQVLDSITLAPLFKILDTHYPHLIVNKPDLSKFAISYGQSFMYM